MSEIREDGTSFMGYEYQELPSGGERTSLYLDCYPSFGWVLDERAQNPPLRGRGKLVLKRERKLVNKVELTRLQRHFEACVHELDELERSRTSAATVCSVAVGLAGTAFLAGSTFAVTHQPPLVPLTVLLAIPGFLGWIAPCFLYRAMVRRRARLVDELVERKYDEICEVCEKGRSLLL